MIEAHGLRKIYDDYRGGPVTALDGVTFRAEPGQAYGLLGPNGAGKTTLLRVLSTLLRPSGGWARVGGCDVVQAPEKVRRRIGVVSSSAGVYDRLTAWENVAFFGRLRGLRAEAVRRRGEQLLEQLGLTPVADRLAGKLSSGMKQKVAIAQALIHDPPVLIFDEATVGLDVLAGRSLLEIVRQLRDAGKCVVFSTHIMREAERVCDRVAILHRGRVVREGALAELLEGSGEPDLESLFFSLIDGEPAAGGAAKRRAARG